ncbi:MAG: DUF1501 domain-containing protein [Rhodanobacteraceae bacterium]|nr:DUF1501 domain-containing protein [Rhodanobacteraceae bacterium]
MDRRDALKHLLCATASSAMFTSLAGKFSLAQAATVSSPRTLLGTGYKALVCVFQYGGNDAINMVIPRDTAGYGVYSNSRSALAIPQNELLQLTPSVPPSGGGSYGLHPGMGGLQNLFNNGRAAIISNVGPLLYPITKAEYQAGSVPVPAQLFSHSDQQVLWQTPTADASDRRGWGGRLADLFYSSNINQQLSMNISIDGENVFQSGNTIVPYFVGQNGAEGIYFVNDEPWNAPRRNAFLALRDASHGHALQREYASRVRRAMDNETMVTSALNSAPALGTPFPDTDLGRQLRMVARLISARGALQMDRQIFFVGQGGYDTHDSQLANHPDMLSDLSASLTAFYDAMSAMGLGDRVTSFTASDFGRTLTSNGDGTDHGWGSHHFVVGDAVQGGRIVGTMPDLTVGGPDDADWGQIIPRIAVDQYAATLSSWYGMSDTDRALVFPNLSRFSSPNLGFMV